MEKKRQKQNPRIKSGRSTRIVRDRSSLRYFPRIDEEIYKVYTSDVDVLFFHRGQQFLWDADKAAANLQKHGVRFESACEVFFDPFVRQTDASVESETRDAAIGVDENWKMMFVVHLIREEGWIRIISARVATAKERKFYEDSY